LKSDRKRPNSRWANLVLLVLFSFNCRRRKAYTAGPRPQAASKYTEVLGHAFATQLLKYLPYCTQNPRDGDSEGNVVAKVTRTTLSAMAGVSWLMLFGRPVLLAVAS
jgi:hypothetical protein